MTSPQGFFAVDRRAWDYVSQRGMNEAVAYLVMARGTGGDQRTTSWSVNAIEKYTGISRPRAKLAVESLIAAKAIERVQSGSRPRYRLTEPQLLPKDAIAGTGAKAKAEPEWIWLPNALVDGVDARIPPVEMLRQTQDLLSLRMFIDLYFGQALEFDGGVEWRPGLGIRQKYSRERIGERGPYVIWGFVPGDTETWHAAKPFSLAPKKRAGDKNNTDFWASWNLLTRTGLVQMVAHLVDADTAQGEVIHPFPFRIDEGEPGEREISAAAARAGLSMLADWQRERLNTSHLVPLLSHLSNVQLVGIARLKFRPNTKATARWYSGSADWAEIAARFDSLAAESAPLVSKTFATSR